MKREIKANVIFAVILLILVAPGAIILVRKKLNGPSDPNYMPKALHNSVAFNQPPPFPPGLPRVEPSDVSKWVGTELVARSNGLAIPIRNPTDQSAIMGSRFRTQLLGQQIIDGKLRIYLLIWDESVTQQSLLKITSVPNNLAGTIQTFASLTPPKNIRHALQRCGYVDPPVSAVWVEVNFDTNTQNVNGLTVERTDRPTQTEEIRFSPLASTTQPR